MGLPSVLSLKTTAIVGVVSLALGVGIGWKGHNVLVYQPHLKADAKIVTKQDKVVIGKAAEGQAIGTAIRNTLDQDRGQASATTNTILRETIRYVPQTVPVPGQCPAIDPANPSGPLRVALADIPVGVLVLTNYAALGEPPPATPDASLDLGSPSGIGLPAFTQGVVSNYGTCHQAFAELKAWRAWGAAVQVWYADLDKQLTAARGRR